MHDSRRLMEQSVLQASRPREQQTVVKYSNKAMAFDPGSSELLPTAYATLNHHMTFEAALKRCACCGPSLQSGEECYSMTTTSVIAHDGDSTKHTVPYIEARAWV